MATSKGIPKFLLDLVVPELPDTPTFFNYLHEVGGLIDGLTIPQRNDAYRRWSAAWATDEEARRHFSEWKLSRAPSASTSASYVGPTGDFASLAGGAVDGGGGAPGGGAPDGAGAPAGAGCCCRRRHHYGSGGGATLQLQPRRHSCGHGGGDVSPEIAAVRTGPPRGHDQSGFLVEQGHGPYQPTGLGFPQ